MFILFVSIHIMKAHSLQCFITHCIFYTWLHAIQFEIAKFSNKMTAIALVQCAMRHGHSIIAMKKIFDADFGCTQVLASSVHFYSKVLTFCATNICCQMMLSRAELAHFSNVSQQKNVSQ